MKKYFLIPIMITLLFTVSCNDQLERFPVDSLVEETAYQNVSDLEAGLRGAINSYGINGVIAFNSIFTDNGRLGADNGGQQLNLLNQILNSQTGDQGIWVNRYRAINNFNRVLAGASTITPTSDEQDTYNNVLAQCYAFRAYAHHELLVYYGADMMNGTAEGVPYQNSVSTSALPSRLTTAEVLTEIENDLTLAASLMPSSSTDINFATPSFITFLRARLALYSGDYTAAITHSNALISSFSLANQTQYAAMFNGDTDSTEVIFKFDNVQGSNSSIAGSWIFTGTGGAFVEMSNEFFGLLTAGDVRRAVNLDAASDPANNLLIIGKYPAGADTNYINDYKAMRLSEIYLIRAEAHARKAAPDFAAAAADVQAIRNARYATAPATPTYTSLNQAISDIKDERRLELAYEGFRYLDCKRYRNILNEGIVRDANDCLGGIPCNLPASSEKFTFPVPQSEINANPNITQAAGY